MGRVTIGVGGPVGSGKTALLDALCKRLRDRYSLAVITNDIYTYEDAEFLMRSGALPLERIRGVQTGGCPIPRSGKTPRSTRRRSTRRSNAFPTSRSCSS